MVYYGLPSPWEAGLEDRIVHAVHEQLGTRPAIDEVRVAFFSADITPPVGAALCDGLVVPASGVDDPLEARGVVLQSNQAPIVLCAVDWVGVGNSGHEEWRRALARAVGTSASRVSLHALHQHDAPGCDFEAAELLEPHGLAAEMFDVEFAREAIRRTSESARQAIDSAVRVTHIGLGSARVEQVASSRRLLGADGRVRWVRWSATTDPLARAQAVGTIDPELSLVAFWNEQQPIAAMTYYATHPQSHYGRGRVSKDFVGIARNAFDARYPELRAIHFNGAGGDITAGKWNDGHEDNRALLAERLLAGMDAAWKTQQRVPVGLEDIDWTSRSVQLPASPRLQERTLSRILENETASHRDRVQAARNLVWLRRTQRGATVEVSCASLGTARLLHLPGELFVEYQLRAKALRPDRFVAMAAYGDYGPGYIGTERSYEQGGYEVGAPSRVAPSVEKVLLRAIRELLQVPSTR